MVDSWRSIHCANPSARSSQALACSSQASHVQQTIRNWCLSGFTPFFHVVNRFRQTYDEVG